MKRRCYMCKLSKPIAHFTNDKNKKYGKSYRCKKCDSIRWTNKRRKMKIEEPERYAAMLKRHKRTVRGYRMFLKKSCEKCGFIPVYICQLDIDHIDNNHKNNLIENLQTLCANCHRLKTYENRGCVIKT